ncbi:MAG: hypothetical protein NTW62_01755 [Candidatus Nomurabacteria bacterium]|nr:hypothetical protein [Candidatus Nomurabacteria bacterium]
MEELFTLEQNAQNNFEALRKNSYPGRFIGIGLDETGTNLIQIYAIMGRSPGSRGRRFEELNNGYIDVRVLDETKVSPQELALIQYPAMAQKGKYFAVSNGAQTMDALSRSMNSCYGLADIAYRDVWTYEPDENTTARITATSVLLDNMKYSTEILLLQKSVFGNTCVKSLYKCDEFTPGFGVYVSTYDGDGNPLPTFTGSPRLIPFTGGQDMVTRKFWDALNSENKVSIVSKFIDIRTGESTVQIINKHELEVAK